MREKTQHVHAYSASLPPVSPSFADMNIYSDRLEELLEELDVAVVAPSHGLPILDLPVTMPKVREGLIAGND